MMRSYDKSFYYFYQIPKFNVIISPRIQEINVRLAGWDPQILYSGWMQPSTIKEYLKTWNEFELDKQIKHWNFCANTTKKNLEG